MHILSTVWALVLFNRPIKRPYGTTQKSWLKHDLPLPMLRSVVFGTVGHGG